MLNFLKVSVSAIALSAFVVAPIATVLSTDYVYAKNGNGKGGEKGENRGGNGGGKGGNAGDKGAQKGLGADKKVIGKSASSASKNKTTKGNGRLSRAVKQDFQALGRSLQQNGIKGLFKGNTSRTNKTRTKVTSVKQSPRPPSRKTELLDDVTLEPRNLGKLNGAINSSVNAKMAHIENGQYAKGTGPVSLAAGLAVADANFSHIMGEDSELTPQDVKEINAAHDYLETATMTLAEAEKVLADEAAAEGSVMSDDLEVAQAVVDAHEVTTDEDGNKIERFTDDQLAAAEAVHEAEDSLLGHYKGDFAEDETVAEQQQDRVLGAVRDSNPDEESVKATLGISGDESNFADVEDNGDAVQEPEEEVQSSDEPEEDPAISSQS